VKKVLISACLLGERVRYDGNILKFNDATLAQWVDDNRVVSTCPEVNGGLSVPRPAAEIFNASAMAVLAGSAKVMDISRADVSPNFLDGAGCTLEMARLKGITVAVLKDGSPSCGSTYVYDGSFSGARIPGCGVTVALLRQNGISVFNENQFDLAAVCLTGR